MSANNKRLTKIQKLRIINASCSKKTLNDFCFYGERLIVNKSKNEIIKGLNRLFEYNKFTIPVSGF